MWRLARSEGVGLMSAIPHLSVESSKAPMQVRQHPQHGVPNLIQSFGPLSGTFWRRNVYFRLCFDRQTCALGWRCHKVIWARGIQASWAAPPVCFPEIFRRSECMVPGAGVAAAGPGTVSGANEFRNTRSKASRLMVGGIWRRDGRHEVQRR